MLWSVDCETEDTFLYAAITNISEMGIFVRTDEPLAVGTSVTLRFAPPREGGRGSERALRPRRRRAVGQQPAPARRQPEPGDGHPLRPLTLADRERIVAAIRTIAYLREEPRVLGNGRN